MLIKVFHIYPPMSYSHRSIFGAFRADSCNDDCKGHFSFRLPLLLPSIAGNVIVDEYETAISEYSYEILVDKHKYNKEALAKAVYEYGDVHREILNKMEKIAYKKDYHVYAKSVY